MSTIVDLRLSRPPGSDGFEDFKVKGFIDSDGERKAILWNGSSIAGERVLSGSYLTDAIEVLASAIAADARQDRYGSGFSRDYISAAFGRNGKDIVLCIGLFSITLSIDGARQILCALAKTMADEPYFVAGPRKAA